MLLDSRHPGSEWSAMSRNKKMSLVRGGAARLSVLATVALVVVVMLAACGESPKFEPPPQTPTPRYEPPPLAPANQPPTIEASDYDAKEGVTWRRWTDGRVEYSIPDDPHIRMAGGVPGMWVSAETLTAVKRKASEIRVNEVLLESQRRQQCINFPELCRDRNPYR